MQVAGDAVALYSDGVPEAYDEQEQEWGEERLRACLREAAGGSAQAAIERVFGQVTRFAGSAPQHDDITMLILKRAEDAEREGAVAGAGLSHGSPESRAESSISAG